MSVVNALSEWMEVEVKRYGSIYSQRFVRGVAEGPLDVGEDPEGSSGTSVRFMPDHLIFRTGLEFEYDRIAGRMDELAYLNAGVKLVMTDMREGLDSSGEPIKRQVVMYCLASQCRGNILTSIPEYSTHSLVWSPTCLHIVVIT